MRFLSLPKIILFFASIFSRKNRKNHGFWHPKTLPKPFQNPLKIDVPKNMRILLEKCFVATAPTSISYWFFQYFLLVGHFSSNRFSNAFWVQKNLPKTSPKRRPNPLKIDVKNVLFFNIDFLGFQPRFWSLLGFQLGAKLASKRNFLHEGCFFFTCLS